MLDRMKRLILQPEATYYGLRGRYLRDGLFRQYSSLARAAGFSRLYFILSFDCDTEEDVQCIDRLHERCVSLGVSPVYAAPGALVEKEKDAFARLAASGAEFMNHGYAMHTYFDSHLGHYVSCYFYDQLSPDEVRRDIREGDRVLRETLGIRPLGFRTPHFGSFQSRAHFELLYGTLKELGYEYSSSAMPILGFRFGPVYTRSAIREFPVSGTLTHPFSVLDSWEFYRPADGVFDGDAYFSRGAEIADYFHDRQICGILNFYADPSHVAGSEFFYRAVAGWMKIARNTTFTKLSGELRNE